MDYNLQNAVNYAAGCFRKTRDPWGCLYVICESTALKFGVPDVQKIVDAVKKQFKPKPIQKWYTCCYRIYDSTGFNGFDCPHVRENTSMKNISELPIKELDGQQYKAVAIHAYKTKADAVKSLQTDYDQYTTKYYDYINQSTS